MKKTSLSVVFSVIFVIAFAGFAYSQQVLDVVSTAAAIPATSGNTDVRLFWTLGELMVDFFPNNAALDQGFLNYKCLISTPVYEVQAPQKAFDWKAWPNPNIDGLLHIQAAQPLSITLLDAYGKAIRHFAAPALHTETLDIALLPAGQYVLQGQSEQGKIGVLRIQKF